MILVGSEEEAPEFIECSFTFYMYILFFYLLPFLICDLVQQNPKEWTIFTIFMAGNIHRVKVFPNSNVLLQDGIK